MATYIPGVCNIGPAEIKARKQIGIIWSFISIILFVILVILDVASLWRIILIIPMSIAFSGFYQAKLHFCAGYGSKGLFNVANDTGKFESVDKAEFRSKDKQKAYQIMGLSLLSALLVTVLLFFI